MTDAWRAQFEKWARGLHGISSGYDFCYIRRIEIPFAGRKNHGYEGSLMTSIKREGKTDSQTLLLPEVAGSESPELKSWALLELFGHQRIVGFLSQQTFGTGVLFRVDVPDLIKEGKVIRVGFTRYFGLSSIYSITPISEEMVKTLLPSIDGTPGEARALSSRSYRYEENDGY